MQLGDFGQPRAQKILQEVFLKYKLAGSFLFDGPAGVGKEALAVEIGRLLNCEREGACAPRGLFHSPPVEADGAACSSCRRFRNLQHPDLHLVFPVPTGFWELTAKPGFELPQDWRGGHEFGAIVEVLAAKARDPYFKPVFERPVGIQAEVLRDVVLPAVQRRPVEARMKVVILSDAEQMAFGIGNVLLKTLEEPPADCLLVLTSSVPERLLPTIRSRCQRLSFAPLSPEWMVPRLQILHGVEAMEARAAAYLSQGSMLVAERSLTGVLREVRDRALAILQAAAQGDALELLQVAHATARGYAAGHRHLFPVLLQILASLARDAMLLAEGAVQVEPAPAAARSVRGNRAAANAAATPAAAGKAKSAAAEAPAGAASSGRPRLVHEDRRAELQQLAQSFDALALRRMVQQTQLAERQIAGYAHGELTLSALFLGLARESRAARQQTARA
ncbi:MAG TPA: hypothetical protein VFE28_03600 [Candidatus Krumholzibacteria bacterium]|nr:hypothetical protein [Candidatus Krumholzibacteria bacterium]